MKVYGFILYSLMIMYIIQVSSQPLAEDDPKDEPTTESELCNIDADCSHPEASYYCPVTCAAMAKRCSAYTDCNPSDFCKDGWCRNFDPRFCDFTICTKKVLSKGGEDVCNKCKSRTATATTRTTSTTIAAAATSVEPRGRSLQITKEEEKEEEEMEKFSDESEKEVEINLNINLNR